MKKTAHLRGPFCLATTANHCEVVAASLVTGGEAGAALAVSVLAGVEVAASVEGAGDEATEAGAAEDAEELGAGSVFSGAGLSGLVLALLAVDDFVDMLDAVERGAGVAGAATAGVRRSSVAVLRRGAGVLTGLASATLGAGSGLAIAGAGATSAAGVAAGSDGATGLEAVCATGPGTTISLSLTLRSNISAPTTTEAVMTPKAIPKCFMGFSFVQSSR